MTPRQRFLETMHFGSPDKVPLQPGGPRESTLAAWHEQGLPEGVSWYDHLMGILGIEREETKPRVNYGVSFIMIPTFEEKVLEHRDGHTIVQDWMGAITEISDAYDYTYIRQAKDFVTRKWHSFPVQSREDWETKIRWRYDPEDPARFPEDFEARCAEIRERDDVASIAFSGPFWQLREWCGMEGLCLLMADEPEFVEEMAAFWTDFMLQTLEPILKLAPPDHIVFNEDMAYKMHSMISPKMVRRFLMPAWERWIAAIRAASPETVIDLDSDGYNGELLPLWIEAGVDACSPMEVAAGNDIVDYRRRYGTQIAFRGGIDKRALAKGGDVMRAELERVVPPLLEEGGFIPGCDHGVPPDIAWPDFVAYTRLLAQMTGWL
ncbi:MAG: uroporphyrinogen decarboxylase family protein [Anaerolineae bacterium]